MIRRFHTGWLAGAVVFVGVAAWVWQISNIGFALPFFVAFGYAMMRVFWVRNPEDQSS